LMLWEKKEFLFINQSFMNISKNILIPVL